MSDRVFIDTNLLIYMFDDDAPAKKSRAIQILRSAGNPDELVLSTQVLQEFYVAVTRKLKQPLPEEDALQVVRGLTTLSVVQITPEMVVEAITFSRAHQASLWDSLIVRAALTAGCQRLLTEDLQSGWQVGTLRVENPFRDT